MKRPKRWWMTLIWTMPNDAIAWLVVLVTRILFGQNLYWIDGLWVELRKDSWPSRQWGRRWNGVTLGHGGIISAGRAGGEGADTRTEKHELVHVEQYESCMLVAFINAAVAGAALCAVGHWKAAVVVGLILWMTAWPVGYLATLFQAYLRGEDPYRGSHLEEAAYSIFTEFDDPNKD